MSLWLCSVALGCGASSDADSASQPAGARSTPAPTDATDDASSSESGYGAAAATAPAAAEETDSEAEPDLSAPDDVAAQPDDAQVTASGLASKVLVVGSGARRPRATDTVRVHYSGWQTDGTLFDSSLSRGTPSEFPLNGVIEGWTEGLQLMVEGEQRRFWIPEELAYRGTPNRPSGMLVFDVELIAILTP